MKKYLFILAIVSLSVQAQTTKVTMDTEKNGFFTVTDDTLIIQASDRVVSGSVKLTNDADSCIIVGCSKTISGISTSPVVMKEGTATVFNFGSNYAFTDTLQIMCYGKVNIVLLYKEKK